MIRPLLRWGFERAWHWPPVLAWQLLPRFRAAHGRWPWLLPPRSFAEKCLYRMLFDRRPIIGVFGGKTEVRALIAERLGNEDALIPRIGLIRSIADLRGMTLPRAFIMKTNHASGQVHRNVFDRNGTWLPVDHLTPRGATAPSLSAAVPRMVAMAERLSAGVDYVRVDLIESAGRIYVTEMTPYPNAAGRNFLQADWDRYVGDYWRMPPWQALRGG